MRVLVIEPAGGLWGSERALLDLIASAPQFEIAVCCPVGTPLVAELQRRGIRVFPWLIERLHQRSRWRRLQAAAAILQACLVFRPAVLHLNQAGAWRIGLPAATLLRLPVIAHVRIFEDTAYLAAQRPSPARLKGIIAISAAVEQDLRLKTELDQIPVHRILDGFQATPAAAPEARRSNRIACVGRITAVKGQAVLLQALSTQQALSQCECWIIGAGDPAELDPLQRQSPPQVVWHGFSANVAQLLSSCSVLVCPSHREPLGRVIFEAWDAGAIPVVFAGSGGAAEVVAAADAGVIYPEQTAASLGQAIAAALALEPAQRVRLLANGRSWLGANCSPQHYGQAITAVFAAACQV